MVFTVLMARILQEPGLCILLCVVSIHLKLGVQKLAMLEDALLPMKELYETHTSNKFTKAVGVIVMV